MNQEREMKEYYRKRDRVNDILENIGIGLTIAMCIFEVALAFDCFH